MNISDLAIAGSIAIIYPLFFNKAVDVFTNYDEIYSKSYKSIFFTDLDTKPNVEVSDTQRQKNKEKLKKINTYRFVLLLVVGLVALVSSYFIGSSAITVGLALAGVVTIVHATCYHWYDINEKTKLALLGIALISLFGTPSFVRKITGKTE